MQTIQNQIDIPTVSKQVAEQAIFDYLFNKKRISTKHVLLSLLFPDEYRIKSSILGLETSLGTKLWESLSIALATYGGFRIEDKHNVIQQPVDTLEEVSNAISAAAQRRETPGSNLPISALEDSLAAACDSARVKVKAWRHLSKGTGIDLAVSKAGKTWVFDIKTVQLNAGSGPKFSRTLIEWKTYWMLGGNSGADLEPRIAIPYNPYVGQSWWAAQSQRVYPLDRTDVCVENDYWQLLTDQPDAYSQIIEGFRQISSANFLSVHKDSLLNPSLETDCRLLEYHRQISPSTAQIPRNRNVRHDWICRQCGLAFKTTINQARHHQCATSP